MKSITLIFSFLFASCCYGNSVDLYSFNVPEEISPAKQTILDIGPSNPSGPEWSCTDRYITRDGQPFMPVMAEFHFSRYPENEWDMQLAKIKAGGVDIVATYLFWIHHEEEEGLFDFTGQRNVRKFIKLCAKNGLDVWVRLGPWCHGEARNGGYPDWMKAKFGVKPSENIGWGQKDKRLRSNDPYYLQFVETLYQAYGEQCRGLMAKDGGPIVGVQVENEYSMRGEGQGAVHIEKLIEIAQKNGFEVPFYSVTGWHNAPFPANQTIPMFGGYPARPWSGLTTKLPPEQVYRFDLGRDSGGIGTDIFKPSVDSSQDLSPYPLMTCEIGVGNQITDHRRPFISTLDGVIPTFTRLGIGAACVGYYVYHGGTNPDGKLSTLQETKATGYPNDCPEKSYDFQAAIRESGRIDEKYHHLRRLHCLMHDFGDQLAPTISLLPDRSPSDDSDFQHVRMALRTDGYAGFLFVNNHVRGYRQADRYQVQVNIQIGDEELLIPAKPIIVPSSAYFVWPVNLQLGDVVLKYATAQPMMVLNHGESKTYVFAHTLATPSEYVFDADTIVGEKTIFNTTSGEYDLIKVKAKNGKIIRILTLSQDASLQAYKHTVEGFDYLYLSDSDLVFNGDGVQVLSDSQSESFVKVYQNESSTDTSCFQTIVSKFPKTRIQQPEVSRIGENKWSIRFDTLDAGSRLQMKYSGDVAKLFVKDRLIYDNFYNGEVFEVSLDRYAEELKNEPLILEITPMHSKKKLYLDVDRPVEQVELVSVSLSFERSFDLIHHLDVP